MASDIEEGEVIDTEEPTGCLTLEHPNGGTVQVQEKAELKQMVSQGWARTKPVNFDSDSSADDDDENSGSALRMNMRQTTAQSDVTRGEMCSQCRVSPCLCNHQVQFFQNTMAGDRPVAVPKRRVNNIWGSILQEEQLENTIKKVGVEEMQLFTKKSDRGAESYAYTKALENKRSLTTEQFDNELNRHSSPQNNEPDLNKSEMFGREVSQSKKRKLSDSDESEHNCESDGDGETKRRKRRQQSQKFASIKDRLGPRMDNSVESSTAAVTTSSPVEDVVNEIMRVLREPKDKVELFESIVEQVGSECALEILAMTQTVEDNGGMMTFDQSRRRAPGGVYIQLLKNDSRMTPEKMKIVFADDQRKFREDSKRKLKEQRQRKLNRKKRALAGHVSQSTIGGTPGDLHHVHQQELLHSTNSNSYDAFDDDDLGASSACIELADC